MLPNISLWGHLSGLLVGLLLLSRLGQQLLMPSNGKLSLQLPTHRLCPTALLPYCRWFAVRRAVMEVLLPRWVWVRRGEQHGAGAPLLGHNRQQSGSLQGCSQYSRARISIRAECGRHCAVCCGYPHRAHRALLRLLRHPVLCYVCHHSDASQDYALVHLLLFHLPCCGRGSDPSYVPT